MPTSELPIDLADRIRTLHLMHNAIRGQAKLSSLTISGRLVKAAVKHAKWMAENANLDHTGNNGSSVGDRTRAEGFTWGRIAENIAMGQGTCKSVMIGWMKSPGHHRNIHLSDITVMGAGCVFSVDGEKKTPYWCVVFGREL